MVDTSRRRFLGRTGRAALLMGAAAIPGSRALPFGPGSDDRLRFGRLEPLASLMQESEPDALMRLLAARLKGGSTTLRELVAAAALANARTFGGHDYIGYHASMALMPSLAIAAEMPDGKEALPVLKVIHRNTERIRAWGGSSSEVLRQNTVGADLRSSSRALLDAARTRDADRVEDLLGASMRDGAGVAFGEMQALLRDNIDVHQVVLAWRSWDLISVTGPEHAYTLLRQAAGQAVHREARRVRERRKAPELRALLPELVERHRLDDLEGVERRAGREEIESLADNVFGATRDEAAAVVAAALARNVAFADVGEALAIAAVRVVLNDPGLAAAQPGKPKGSVHGASLGVHASDSAQAWRSIAAVVPHAEARRTLVAAAWHTGGLGRQVNAEPCHRSCREEAARTPAGERSVALARALADGNQPHAAALAEGWLAAGLDPERAFALIRHEMVVWDGALHHEKFFHTCREGFALSAPETRPLWLAAAARVAASGHGHVSAGYRSAFKALRG